MKNTISTGSKTQLHAITEMGIQNYLTEQLKKDEK